MGFVFQSSNLLPVYTALENVALPMVLGGTAPSAAAARPLAPRSNESGWAIGSRTIPTSCRAASSNGSRSRARS